MVLCGGAIDLKDIEVDSFFLPIHRVGSSIVCVVLILSVSSLRAGEFRVLHTFDDVGLRPVGGLTVVGDLLLGTTTASFTDSAPPPFGFVFSMQRNGSGYQEIHDFLGPEGANPESSMRLVGSSLIGTTGGRRAGQPITGNAGTLFSVSADGTDYQVIHAFGTNFLDHGPVYSPIVASGSVYFGTKNNGNGDVWAINNDGSGFQLLHTFSGTDGSVPAAGLTISGATLYGATTKGGAANSGVVFSIGMDGSNFRVLHEFSGGETDGELPLGELTQVGTKLYGTTSEGGTDDYGVIFSINTDGTGYQVLHTFDDIFAGGRPAAGLTLLGSKLYGGGYQSLFSINPDGTNFQTLHTLSGTDGFTIQSELVAVGSTLYGTATFGGSSANAGTVFAFLIPEPAGISLAAVGILGLVIVAVRGRRHRQT